ncbi:hypothetical protein GEV29_04525 [Aeromicrobium sp. SMF47]|nr:hypothetical protein [Aeromicrobium yanjiei]MRJ75792.1 hypothetical protein [Aeromicrobium yanjiei]
MAIRGPHCTVAEASVQCGREKYDQYVDWSGPVLRKFKAKHALKPF